MGEIITDAYFTEQYKSTSYTAYCPECSMRILTFNGSDSIDCVLCGNELENSQITVDVFQDPKYTTTSC